MRHWSWILIPDNDDIWHILWVLLWWFQIISVQCWLNSNISANLLLSSNGNKGKCYLDQHCLLQNIGQFEIRIPVATVQRSHHHLGCSQNQSSNIDLYILGVCKFVEVLFWYISYRVTLSSLCIQWFKSVYSENRKQCKIWIFCCVGFNSKHVMSLC